MQTGKEKVKRGRVLFWDRWENQQEKGARRQGRGVMQTQMFSCMWSYSLRGKDPGKIGKGRERRCVWEEKRYVVMGTNSQKMQKERNEVITERALKLPLLWWEGEREEKLEGETQGFGGKQGRRWGSSRPLILLPHSSWRWDGRLQCGSCDSAVNGMKRLYAKAVNSETN